MTDNFIKLFPKNGSNRSPDTSDILKSIPSTSKRESQINEDKRKSSERKKSKNHHKYEMNRTSSQISAVKNKQTQPPVVTGKAVLKTFADLTADQLCCEYNQDGSSFACGGADGLVRVYDTSSGDLKTTLTGENSKTGEFSCVTCIRHIRGKNVPQSDSHLMCSYVNGILKYNNYVTGESIFKIKENRQTYGLIFHPRLPKFITYGDDLKIYMYDYETRTRERTFQGSQSRERHDGPASRVFAACFNPTSNTEFITGGWDDTVLLWDLRVEHAVRHLSGVHACGDALDIDAAGKQVLTCSWRKEDQLQLWDYSTFRLITTMFPDTFSSQLYCGCFMSQDFFACGGGVPPILRVADRHAQKSRALVTGLANDVYHLSIGRTKSSSLDETTTTTDKGTKSKTVEKEEEEAALPQIDLSKEPKILFSSGGRIYELSF